MGSRRVLVVDDEPEARELIAAGLARRGYATASQPTIDGAEHDLRQQDFDLVVTDVQLGGARTGIDLCAWTIANRPGVPVIVVTGHERIDTAVAAIRAGAYDFITKPIDLEALSLAIQRALDHRDLAAEVHRLRRTAADRPFDHIVGESRPMQRLFDLVARVSEGDASVLISGESGTGKELVARAIHQRSPRATGPFVAINCAAMPASLLESELFGHLRGAFTDAKRTRDGLFVRASGGTLLLDEIGELSLAVQPKLLRALQEGRLRPVGADNEVAFETRIIASTNRDLETAVEEGRFREDLYYRINVVELQVPPLRARGTDVLLLAQHFLERQRDRLGKPVTGISATAARQLLDYDWPGNVRELENCIERAVTLTTFDQITVDDLPHKVQQYQSPSLVIGGADPAQFLPLAEMEKRYIHRVLAAAGGNKTQAARILGVDRRTLYRKLERLGEPRERS